MNYSCADVSLITTLEHSLFWHFLLLMRIKHALLVLPISNRIDPKMFYNTFAEFSLCMREIGCAPCFTTALRPCGCVLRTTAASWWGCGSCRADRRVVYVIRTAEVSCFRRRMIGTKAQDYLKGLIVKSVLLGPDRGRLYNTDVHGQSLAVASVKSLNPTVGRCRVIGYSSSLIPWSVRTVGTV